jgi:hypothetical protein
MAKLAAPVLLGILLNAGMFGVTSISYIRYWSNFGVRKYAHSATPTDANLYEQRTTMDRCNRFRHIHPRHHQRLVQRHYLL